jgi:hypothetical protein
MHTYRSDEHVTWEMPSEYAPLCDPAAATHLDLNLDLRLEAARSEVRTSCA